MAQFVDMLIDKGVDKDDAIEVCESEVYHNFV